MRKHSYRTTHRRAVFAAAAVTLFLAACNSSHDAAGSASTDSGASVAAVMPPAMATAPMSDNAAAGVEMSVTREKSANDAVASPVPQGLASQPLPSAGDFAGAMLVRTGEASLEVKRVEDALARARQTATQFGGFVANTSLRNGRDETHAATIELRVPTAQFDALIGSLDALGKVESVTANVQDVGEEYVDLGARASNARRMEARLVEMMATRTGKLSDALTVEQELKRVREEIERYDARLRWLERRASTSTLTVSLHEPLALIDRPRPGPIVEALGLAWQRTLGVIAWCIASLGVIVPVGVLIGLGVLAVRRLQPPRYRAE